jgi:hypothetical protein
MPAIIPHLAEIKLVPGKFMEFRATTKVHCGDISVDVREGDTVQFDGQVLKYQGVDYQYAKFRSALNVGWVVPAKDNISMYLPKPAEMKVRPAQDKTGGQKPTKSVPITVASDERQVSKTFSNKVVAADDISDEGEKVGSIRRNLSVVDQDTTEREVRSATSKPTKAAETASKPMKVAADSTNEDARPVGKLTRPASQKIVLTDASAAERETRQLDEGPRTKIVAPAARPKTEILPSKSGQDVYAAEAEKVEDVLDALEPENRAKAVAKARREKAEASAVAAGFQAPAKAAPKAPAKAAAAPTKPAAQPAAKVAAAKSEPAPKAPTAKKALPKTIEQIVMEGDEIDLGGGLKWDMKLHWLQRAKLAADLYAKSPKNMERVLEIETAAVKKFTKQILDKRLERLAEQG